MRSEIVSFLTGEQEAQFVASSSDSEVANGTTEEFDIGVAGAEPVKKVRVWSSFIEGSEGQSDKSDLENTASVRGHVQTIFGKINVIMTLRGGGGGGSL